MLGLIVGLLLGGALGVFAMAAMFLASSADDQMEEHFKNQINNHSSKE